MGNASFSWIRVIPTNIQQLCLFDQLKFGVLRTLLKKIWQMLAQ